MSQSSNTNNSADSGTSTGSDSSSNGEKQPLRAWTSVDRRVEGQLSKEEFLKIANARRAIWNGGFSGLGIGGVGGVLAYYALDFFRGGGSGSKDKKIGAPGTTLLAGGQGQGLPPNRAKRGLLLAYGLIGAAIGANIGAASQAFKVQPSVDEVLVEHSSAKEPATRYQRQIARAQQQLPAPGTGTQTNEQASNESSTDDDDDVPSRGASDTRKQTRAATTTAASAASAAGTNDYIDPHPLVGGSKLMDQLFAEKDQGDDNTHSKHDRQQRQLEGDRNGGRSSAGGGW